MYHPLPQVSLGVGDCEHFVCGSGELSSPVAFKWSCDLRLGLKCIIYTQHGPHHCDATVPYIKYHRDKDFQIQIAHASYSYEFTWSSTVTCCQLFLMGAICVSVISLRRSNVLSNFLILGFFLCPLCSARMAPPFLLFASQQCLNPFLRRVLRPDRKKDQKTKIEVDRMGLKSLANDERIVKRSCCYDYSSLSILIVIVIVGVIILNNVIKININTLLLPIPMPIMIMAMSATSIWITVIKFFNSR